MDLTTLQSFRQEIYRCFGASRDALFEMMDALIDSPQAQSFPEITLSPHFRRRWPSLYEALEDGRLDRARLRHRVVNYLVDQSEEKRLVLCIDATSIERPCSETSPDRTALPMHNIPQSRPKKATALTFGWQYSTLTVLDEKPSSWTAILDQERVPSDQTPNQVAVRQLGLIIPLLKKRPLIVLDRGYDCTWLWCQCQQLALDLLGRLKGNRTFYKPAPPPKKKRGRPRLHGEKLQLRDATTQQQPDGTWSGTDGKDRPVQIHWWTQMHPYDALHLNLTIIQVIRPRAQGSKRDPRVCWLVYQGQELQPDAVASTALLYCLRFGCEHGYRFAKQALLWTAPRLRTPAQFDLWSQIVALAQNLIVLARGLVEPQLHPWENKQRPASPNQVRRGLRKILPQLGTPASPPKRRGYSPGRQKGAVVRRAPRHPVVRKTARDPQLVAN